MSNRCAVEPRLWVRTIEGALDHGNVPEVVEAGRYAGINQPDLAATSQPVGNARPAPADGLHRRAIEQMIVADGVGIGDRIERVECAVIAEADRAAQQSQRAGKACQFGSLDDVETLLAKVGKLPLAKIERDEFAASIAETVAVGIDPVTFVEDDPLRLGLGGSIFPARIVPAVVIIVIAIIIIAIIVIAIIIIVVSFTIIIVVVSVIVVSIIVVIASVSVSVSVSVIVVSFSFSVVVFGGIIAVFIIFGIVGIIVVGVVVVLLIVIVIVIVIVASILRSERCVEEMGDGRKRQCGREQPHHGNSDLHYATPREQK
jgi:hypothetical protein